jgi:hypothetical protein
MSGATLTLELNYTAAIGQSFTILDVLGPDVISGQFMNAPDGSVVLANGQSFLVSYEGGNGNDLTLMTVPEPTSLSLLGVCATWRMISHLRRLRRRQMRAGMCRWN